MTVECRHTPQHVHGTRAMYHADRCRCPACREAKTAAQRADRRREAQLRWVGRGLRLDATGTRRRVQALAAIGWSQAALAAELGCHKRAVGFLLTYRHVSDATAARVAALYDRCWDKPRHGWAADAARAHARDKGWLPPLAWDDDEIDNPAARPHLPRGQSAVDLKPCGTRAAYRRHLRHNETPCTACRRAEARGEDAA